MSGLIKFPINFYLLLICLIFDGNIAENNTNEKSYGVDISYPIHYGIDPNSYQGQRFRKIIEGCYKYYSKVECESTERARLSMNRDQPAHQHNYTEIGFKKIKVPKDAWDLISNFWETNKNKMEPESWPRGYTYTNHWVNPTYMVSLEDNRLRGSGDVLKKSIWNILRPVLEEWTGKKVIETSMYGIRVYQDQAILATHVDRLPLVSSAIIQVAQDLEEPWPVEVYSHDGIAYNVTMEPGDMVLYESHTVLHGRPFPLKGKMYANLFVHYIPVDHSQNNMDDAKSNNNNNDIHHEYEATTKVLKISGHEQSNHDAEEIRRHKEDITKEEEQSETAPELVTEALKDSDVRLHMINDQIQARDNYHRGEPPSDIDDNDSGNEFLKSQARHHQLEFIRKRDIALLGVDQNRDNHLSSESDRGEEAGESDMRAQQDEEEEEDVQDHDSEEEEENWEEDQEGLPEGQLDILSAASEGNLQRVKELLEEDITLANKKDRNDWQPIHEAVRAGHIDVVRYLLQHGAVLTQHTKRGGTPLWWAKRELHEHHHVIQFLEEIGAPDEGEDL